MLTISVPVRHVTNATPRTRILSLDLSQQSFPFAAGQAVMIGLHGSALRKPYSIASAPWEVRKSGVMQRYSFLNSSMAFSGKATGTPRSG